jgi:hypothetical protein
MKSFETWETQDLEMTFGLQRVKNMSHLNDWLSAKSEFNETTIQRIEILRESIADFADYWNEDELKMQGISIVLDIANFRDKKYTIYSQRTLTATVQGIEMGGRVDFMLARGFQKPIKPYFFIHEYKQEKRREGDPKGQLLAELLTAQYRNEGKFPLYGCYVVGRNWFFVVLQGSEYAVSDAYVASGKDIYQIIAILRQVKVYIEAIIAAETEPLKPQPLAQK